MQYNQDRKEGEGTALNYNPNANKNYYGNDLNNNSSQTNNTPYTSEQNNNIPKNVIVRPHNNNIDDKQQIQMYGNDPVQLKCHSCGETINTAIQVQPGGGTCLMSGIMFLIFWPLTCLPCCIPACQDKMHYCPKCDEEIGIKKFIC